MSFTSSVDHAPRWRDVYIASGARAISYCGDFLAATVLALTLQTRGDNGHGVASLMMAEILPLALFAPLAGRLADRVDSRRLLVLAGGAQAIVCAILAYTDHPAAIIGLVALLSTGLAITQPTLAALTPEMVGREHLPKAMSISQTAGAVGMLAGPALGGLLVGVYGVRLPLLLDAVTFLAIVAAGLALRTRRGGRAGATAHTHPTVQTHSTAPAHAAPSPEVSAASGAVWRLRDDRILMTFLTALGAVIAAVTAVSVVELFFVRETLHASTVMYGLVGAAWTLGTLVGAWPFSRVRGDDRRMVTIFLFLLAGLSVIVLVSAGVPAAIWLVPFYIVGGGLNAGLNVLAGVTLGRRVPSAIRGRVAGVFTGVANTATMVGYGMGGALLPYFSPRSLIAAAGFASLLVASLFLVPVVTGALRAKVPVGSAAGVGYRAGT